MSATRRTLALVGLLVAVILPSLDEIHAEKARRHLEPFIERHWPTVEPRAPYKSNWHIGALCEHLEAVSMGQITDLLANIPPGCMKSYTASVFWPAWEWLDRPEHRYLGGSYDEALSIRDARRARDIIKSDLYQRDRQLAHGKGLALRDDQDTKTRYDNDQSGWRIATSVGGKGTGEHPTRKIIDDPHNVKQSLSQKQRQQALDWFDLTMGSRGLALGAATIVIMQRLHEEDLSGHILEILGDQFVHLCLPMRYEPPAFVEVKAGTKVHDAATGKTRVTTADEKVLTARMPRTPLGFQDPRTTPGELLWPAHFTEAMVTKLELQLSATHGDYGPAGQLQQRPIPQTGGLFQREWFPIVDAIPADARIVRRTRGWDTGATEADGDWTVGVRMALTDDGLVYVEDVERGQWGPAKFEGEKGIFKQVVTMDGPSVRQREAQEPGSAGKKIGLAHTTLLHGYDYECVYETGDKQTRCYAFRSQASVGNVRLVRGPWNKPYLDVLCVFPNGKHDDDVDASSTAYNDLALGPKKPRGGVWGR